MEQPLLANTYWEQLYESLQTELAEFAQQEKNSLLWAQHCMEACMAKLTLLKSRVSEQSFTDASEEIHFFKSVKPQFHHLFIYYSKLYKIELQRPAGGRSVVEQYFQKEQFKLELFYERYADFYQYYRSGETDRDEQYFMRGKQGGGMVRYTRHIDVDPAFTTPMDYTVSRMLANDLLLPYLEQARRNLLEEPAARPSGSKKPLLQWTGKVISLAELVYFLLANEVINDGKAPATAIAAVLADSFNIKLDHLSKKFEEIRMRKKDRATFMSPGMLRFENRMEQDDLNAR